VTDDDVIAYLAGEEARHRSSAETASLDELRALLADPVMWAEPDPALETRVTTAVIQAAATRQDPGPLPGAGRSRRRPRRRLLTAAAGAVAAAAVVAAIAIGVSRSGGPAPLQYRAALAGTSLAPRAAGQVTLTRTTSGWRVVLTGTGLPRLDDGQYYEAWLKNPAGVLVPIGTFNQPESVTLWSGVSPQQFPAITITRQRADGNPASSGQRVLTGEARPA
jgi:hypothetical protein